MKCQGKVALGVEKSFVLNAVQQIGKTKRFSFRKLKVKGTICTYQLNPICLTGAMASAYR